MEWSVWGPCTRTCGQGGVQKRTAAAASTQYEFYQIFNPIHNLEEKYIKYVLDPKLIRSNRKTYPETSIFSHYFYDKLCKVSPVSVDLRVSQISAI